MDPKVLEGLAALGDPREVADRAEHRAEGDDQREALEQAAHDGRLEQLEGFGPRRAQMIRTALAERLDPEDVREFQNALFEMLAGVVAHYDGFVEKFVGDAVVVVTDNDRESVAACHAVWACFSRYCFCFWWVPAGP